MQNVILSLLPPCPEWSKEATESFKEVAECIKEGPARVKEAVTSDKEAVTSIKEAVERIVEAVTCIKEEVTKVKEGAECIKEGMASVKEEELGSCRVRVGVLTLLNTEHRLTNVEVFYPKSETRNPIHISLNLKRFKCIL